MRPKPDVLAPTASFMGLLHQADQITKKAAEEVHHGELARAEQLLEARLDAQLEEHVEEDVHVVHVQHHREHHAPELPGGDGGTPRGAWRNLDCVVAVWGPDMEKY